MKYWTLAEIRAKIERENDLEDEDFVRSEELTEYINEAIDEAEAEIHSLYEDYFLRKTTVNVVANDTQIDLPTDIYAHKIRRVLFREGTDPTNPTVYTVNRVKDWRKFEEKAVLDSGMSTDLYQYFITNETPGSPKIEIMPKIRETGVMTLWYLRNANRLSAITDICDIPEFINFIFSHVRVKVQEKEGHPGLQESLLKLEAERARMNGVLANMVPDADNTIEMDMSAYEEMN